MSATDPGDDALARRLAALATPLAEAFHARLAVLAPALRPPLYAPLLEAVLAADDPERLTAGTAALAAAQPDARAADWARAVDAVGWALRDVLAEAFGPAESARLQRGCALVVGLLGRSADRRAGRGSPRAGEPLARGRRDQVG